MSSWEVSTQCADYILAVVLAMLVRDCVLTMLVRGQYVHVHIHRTSAFYTHYLLHSVPVHVHKYVIYGIGGGLGGWW